MREELAEGCCCNFTNGGRFPCGLVFDISVFEEVIGFAVFFPLVPIFAFAGGARGGALALDPNMLDASVRETRVKPGFVEVED